MQLQSPRLKLWFRIKLQKSVIFKSRIHTFQERGGGLGALDGSVGMSSEYFYDFSCIFRTSLFIIVKHRGGGGGAVAPSEIRAWIVILI